MYPEPDQPLTCRMVLYFLVARGDEHMSRSLISASGGGVCPPIEIGTDRHV
jgi:hypothetical protein